MESEYHCKVCYRVFNLQQESMSVHNLTCVKPSNAAGSGTSFYAAWAELGGRPHHHAVSREEREIDDREKVALPDTQETLPETSCTGLDQTNEKQQEVCKFCSRKFVSIRGLHQHLRSCKMKKKNQTGASKNDNTPPVSGLEGTQTQTPANPQQRGEENTIDRGQPTQQTQSSAAWGEHTADDLVQMISGIYDEVVTFQKNFFKLPSGAAGKRFLKEKTRLIEIWNEGKQPPSAKYL